MRLDSDSRKRSSNLNLNTSTAGAIAGLLSADKPPGARRGQASHGPFHALAGTLTWHVTSPRVYTGRRRQCQAAVLTSLCVALSEHTQECNCTREERRSMDPLDPLTRKYASDPITDEAVSLRLSNGQRRTGTELASSRGSLCSRQRWKGRYQSRVGLQRHTRA
jgi:hypothetical protein